MATAEYYTKAEQARNYRFDDKMNYLSLLQQLNNHNGLSDKRWSYEYVNNDIYLKCANTLVLELHKDPQRFVFHDDATPCAFNPYEEDLGNYYNYTGVYNGFVPYELSIMLHFLRKANWQYWFDI